MKPKQILIGLATLMFITLTLSSCKKESGTSSGMNLKVRAVNPSYNIPVQNGGSGTPITSLPMVTWDTALLVVSEVKFDAEMRESESAGEPHEVSLSWVGPKVVDLFNVNLTLGNIPIPAGQYEEIEFTIFANASDAGSRPVFYLSGTYTNSSGTTLPLVISISDDIIIKLEKEHVTLTAGSTTPVSGLIQLYLERLFSSILPKDLDNSVVSEGKIVISSTSNPDLYLMILENLGHDGDYEFEHGD